ncbi:uncharacterized protein LOC100378663 [Saccoglossus kowalevskii]|uniref:Ubiquitin carboxyl-terminal hydrolase n=1 Tax=Saccoglossus kowalevskii TaxID=10224 RepID=A0ABM0M6J3_SACKO|nr:PREDICTED: ubiquitin carboxyl-terminal hydrolase 10-like [Saccoglossus kowalevskii]
MSLFHTELSFGDFSGLSAEEYDKLFGALRKPLSNNKVQFPWNEEEYIQSGIEALSTDDEGSVADHTQLNQYVVIHCANAVHNIAPAQLTDKTVINTQPICASTEQSSHCNPAHGNDKQAIGNTVNNVQNDKENSFESSKDVYSSFDNGDNDNNVNSSETSLYGNNGNDKPRRRNKKKRDPNYYQKYYENPNSPNHGDQHDGDQTFKENKQRFDYDRNQEYLQEKTTNSTAPRNDIVLPELPAAHRKDDISQKAAPAPKDIELQAVAVAPGKDIVLQDLTAANRKDIVSQNAAPAAPKDNVLQNVSKNNKVPKLEKVTQTDEFLVSVTQEPVLTITEPVLSQSVHTQPIPTRTSTEQEVISANKPTEHVLPTEIITQETATDANNKVLEAVAPVDVSCQGMPKDNDKLTGCTDKIETVNITSTHAITDSTMHIDKGESNTHNALGATQDAPVHSESLSEIPKESSDGKSEEPLPVSVQEENNANDSNKPKVSWAGLFKNTAVSSSSPVAYVSHVNSDPPKPPPVAKKALDDVSEEEMPVAPEDDKRANNLGEFLINVKFPYRALALQPRGLNNVGNWCYINATLQALLSCPPMYNLLKSLPVTPLFRRGPSCTPMMDCLAHFVTEFTPMPKAGGVKRTAQDLRPGAPFEPTYVYRLLALVKSSMSTKGRQEDAEEFLGFVLNGLHEEMLACMQYFTGVKEETKSAKMNGPSSAVNANGPSDGEVTAVNNDDDDEEEWEQVGPKNKSSITRAANFSKSPISEIFGGQMRSAVHQHGSKESATLQPFFTLQLDIQSDKIWSVKDALQSLVSRETLHDYTSSKPNKLEVETIRKISLEELPPVLVLHLKRFVYDKSGGCQKMTKKIDYSVDLEINKELLSSNVRSKLAQTQRSYKLFAVVYHHGVKASGGHYTCDFYHPGINGWVRTDDSNVHAVPIPSILRPMPPKFAYLLYYRRCDLI